MSTTQETVTLRLTLDVTYTMNGVTEEYLLDNLHDLAMTGIGNGGLTASSEAEVDVYSILTSKQPAPMPEEDAIAIIGERVARGLVSEEDIPVLMARYGLMEPGHFIEELMERKALEDEDFSDGEEASCPIEGFAEAFEVFKSRNTALIASFEAFIAEKFEGSEIEQEMDEYLDDCASEIKGRLGSDAANQVGTEEDQETAITVAEEWITDNISNRGMSERIAAAIMEQGFDGLHQIMLKAGHTLPLREVAETDIEKCLRDHVFRVTDTQGKSFRAMAMSLISEIEWVPVPSDALAGYVEQSLVQHRVLEPR